ncbi:MAG: protein-N(pi)-phosphohistidine--sugar phosphotransferase, partial [Lachnospirales bacterium]
SHGFTALCRITEPAFYGALIKTPKILLSTAFGAGIAAIFASIFELKSFVMGGSPGFLTLPYFLEPNGDIGNLIIALITAGIAIVLSFITATIILQRITVTN